MKSYTLIAISFILGICLAFAQVPPKPPSSPAKPQTGAVKPAPKPAASEPVQDEPVPPDAPGALFPSVVARVNGKAVLGRDLQQRIQNELTPIGNPEWKNLKEDYQQELIGQSLGSLVATELIYQKAVSMGLKATDAEVQSEFAKAAKNFGSDADMNIALANRGMDRTSLMKDLGRSLTVSKYVNETIGKKITVTPAEVSDYYAGHKSAFNHPDLIRTSQIFIMVPESATPEQDKLARQRAEMVLARARKGEDFARLAKEYSMDGSASNGGDVGLVPKGSLNPEYEEAAFALQVGAVSDIVRTQVGYHIIKVTEKRKAGLAELDEVRPALMDFLKTQRVDAEVSKVVDTLRGSAKIEILLKLVKPLTYGGITASSPRQ